VAVIEILIDPNWFGDWPVRLVIRWETIAVAALVAATIVLAAWRARRSGAEAGLEPLRLDDLLFITVAVLPGAVIGGRLLYGLDYLDVYALEPAALLDPARGSLSLVGAVIGGTLSGAYIARVLDASWRRWLDVAAPLLLLALAAGKGAQCLGGGGQGLPWDGQWAVAFLGPGPWKSVAPDVPAYPAQLFEGAWALLGILPLAVASAATVARRLPERFRQDGAWAERREARGAEVEPGRLRFGLPFLFALAWWLVGRFAVAFSWRDERLLGPLGVEQALGLAALVGVVMVLGLAVRQSSEG
jgi:prolipoprotein diacylglyceryltransferase